MNREDVLLSLLGSHGDALRRITRVYAESSGEAEDLYQEIVMQAWMSLARFRGDSELSTWLYRVALNTALTWRRRSARRTTAEVELESDDHEDHTGGTRIRPTSTTSANTVSARAQTDILEEFLSSLAGPNHTVLILYMEGLSYEEIAEVTGLSENAVGVRLHRMKNAYTKRFLEG